MCVGGGVLDRMSGPLPGTGWMSDKSGEPWPLISGSGLTCLGGISTGFKRRVSQRRAPEESIPEESVPEESRRWPDVLVVVSRQLD